MVILELIRAPKLRRLWVIKLILWLKGAVIRIEIKQKTGYYVPLVGSESFVPDVFLR